MISVCRFNPAVDLQEVVPGLSTSIQMALSSGVIKDNAQSLPYSKETSTDEVGHYLHDAIDIALEHRRVSGIINAASNEANFNVPEE